LGQNQKPVVNMAVAHLGVAGTDLVSHPSNPEAFPGNVPLPAGGGAAGEQFRGLADGADLLYFGIPSSQGALSSVSVCGCGPLRCGGRYGGMVVSQHDQ
jgi:hypothetical protein